MSNSSLSVMRQISPNRNSPRGHEIDTITIHCAAGQASIEGLCGLFARESTGASCNYGIGADGRVCTVVDEGDRSWCSSSPENDNRAVTIECASDSTHPYAVNENVWASLIELCVDICRRNGIERLVWSTDKNARVNHLNGCNMTVHRDYANKACPGDYLYSRMGLIAGEVNQRLAEAKEPDKPSQGETIYNSIQDVPDYWRDDIGELVEKGVIKGDGKGLGLTPSEAKMAVIMKRLVEGL